MTWLTPLLAGIAAVIAVPSLIILYFLKLRRRDVEISTTLLWKKTIQDLQANAPFQRLRRNILLLLQLIVLGAALAAVGQPQIMGTPTAAQRHVILIDRSASMQAMDTGSEQAPRSRLDTAKDEALRLIDTLREPSPFGFGRRKADEAMVIAFASSAEVRQTFTSDKSLLRAAVEAIEPVDTPSALAEAVALVAAQAPPARIQDVAPDGTVREYDRPPGRVGTIHLWSDGRLPDAADAKFGPEDEVKFYPVGQADAVNAGITSLRPTRDFNDPANLSIFVGLHSTARRPRQVDVELRIDDVPQRIETVTIPAAAAVTRDAGPGAPGAPAPEGAPPPETLREQWQPGTSGVVFRLKRPEGGVVSVSLSSPAEPVPDALSVDNTAWVVAPPAKQMAVAVVSREGNLFLADTVASLPVSRADSFSPETWAAAVKAGRSGQYDVVVLDGALPDADPATGALPPGRYLIFGVVPGGPYGLRETGVNELPAIMLDWSRDHPALRGLPLDSVYFFKQRLVEVGDGPRILASTDAGPAIVEVASADTRALVVLNPSLSTNWYWEVSWLVFMGSAIQYLGEEGGSGVGSMIQPGEVLSDRLPAGASNVRVSLPRGGSATVLPAPDGKVVYGPVLKAGVYMLSWSGPKGETDVQSGDRVLRAFTANLLSPEESDIGTRASIRTGSNTYAGSTGEAARGKAPQALWPWLILAAVAVVMLEWFVYNKKVHI